MTEVRLKDITIGPRHRKDLGDLDGLVESIRSIGLLHPIVLSKDKKLICGQRRLEAFRKLGRATIPAHVISLDDLLLAERDENVVRADFLPTEAVAISKALEERERVLAKERQEATQAKPGQQVGKHIGGGKLPPPSHRGKARDKAAARVGISGRTLDKAKAVVEAADRDPQKFGDLPAEMDRTRKVDRAYKRLKELQDHEALIAAAAALPPADQRFELHHGDFAKACACMPAASVDAIICDPPYAREFVPLYGQLAQVAARLLKPGGSLAVMTGQSYLLDIATAMAQHLSYRWVVAYLTPGGQAPQIWDRKVNTFWKPVLLFTKGAIDGDWIGDVVKSDVNDKAHHRWGQSESGMARLVERLTKPGDVVLDPFLGGGTTGVVAVRLQRRFIGIDVDTQALATARARIAVASQVAA